MKLLESFPVKRSAGVKKKKKKESVSHTKELLYKLQYKSFLFAAQAEIVAVIIICIGRLFLIFQFL